MLDAHPQIDEIPFEPEQRYAATFHRTDGERRVFVKGAPERVLDLCTDASEGEFSQPALQKQATEMAHDGYRVLAIAESAVKTDGKLEQPPSEPTDLTFLGFPGLIDPLRSGVAEAIASAH